MRTFRWAIAATLLVGARPTAAQLTELSDAAQVSLVTIYPGEAIYALWGHSALRIYDPGRSLDILYNYGTFDFGDPLAFVARFAYGKLDYALSRQHYRLTVDHAQHVQGRSVVEQHLRLSTAQKEMLFQFLEGNARPENRTYRYDFLFDNCATRIRDLFTEVLQIPLPAAAASTDTYREMLRPYASGRSLLNQGINLGMGLPADQPVTDRSFLPLELMHVVAAMQTDAGTLVAQTDTLYAAPSAAGRAIPWAVLGAWLALALGIAISFKGDARTTRAFDGILYLLLGLAGLLIVFLWQVSLHNVTQPNYNVAWLWPTHVVVTFWRGQARWLRTYHLAAAITAVCFVLLIPVLPQSIPAAALPLAALAALRSMQRAGLLYRVRDLNPCYRRERPAS